MKTKELLVEIIEHLFAFYAEQNDTDYDLMDFIGFLNARTEERDLKMRSIAGENTRSTDFKYRNTNSDVSILLVFMYRYARGYIKQALNGANLQTPEEFSFLITLMTFESLAKTELINMQVVEKTSGAEIIRRLVTSGFIKETDDLNDRRRIRISITEKGRQEVLSLLPVMHMVSNIVVGNLSGSEINTLAYLLKKLDHFHNDIFRNKRDIPLAKLTGNDKLQNGLMSEREFADLVPGS